MTANLDEGNLIHAKVNNLLSWLQTINCKIHHFVMLDRQWNETQLVTWDLAVFSPNMCLINA